MIKILFKHKILDKNTVLRKEIQKYFDQQKDLIHKEIDMTKQENGRLLTRLHDQLKVNLLKI